MNEYGKYGDLQEILEDLTVYCALNFANSNDIKVILPKKIIEQFSIGFRPIAKTTLTDTAKDMAIRTLWTSMGTVSLHSIEDNQTAIGELV